MSLSAAPGSSFTHTACAHQVYNITHYLKYHPGGVEILAKVAGKDGTALFLKYHPYVNIRALMEKCLVGRLAVDPLQVWGMDDKMWGEGRYVT